MADLSLTDMIYSILEYASEGMSVPQLQTELVSQFEWDGSPERLEQELKARSEFCCDGENWTMSPD